MKVSTAQNRWMTPAASNPPRRWATTCAQRVLPRRPHHARQEIPSNPPARAHSVAAGTPVLRTVFQASGLPQGGKSWHNWFNEGAFSQPLAGQFGEQAQRNPLVGPSVNEFNLSLVKEFPIWEEVKFQIRCDATNAFNHPSFGAIPGGNNRNFGLTGGGPGQPFTGNAVLSSTTVGGRALQLSGRITF